MSVVPLIFRDWWDDFERPVSRLMDQHFARGLDRDDLISRFSDLNLDRPARSIFGNRYYRPWRNVTRQHSSGSSTIQIDGKDNFQVGGFDRRYGTVRADCGRRQASGVLATPRRSIAQLNLQSPEKSDRCSSVWQPTLFSRLSV